MKFRLLIAILNSLFEYFSNLTPNKKKQIKAEYNQMKLSFNNAWQVQILSSHQL